LRFRDADLGCGSGGISFCGFWDGYGLRGWGVMYRARIRGYGFKFGFGWGGIGGLGMVFVAALLKFDDVEV
jgi:hypothetical protein